ncbi:hypothetical protein EV128_12577 [Rhizobium azibense]|nr:hypothetical protein EV128_12577 [Rhizobium azibense]
MTKAPETFIHIDGARITGEPDKIKAFVEFYIRAKVQAGSGAIMTECSRDLVEWSKDLMHQFPPKPILQRPTFLEKREGFIEDAPNFKLTKPGYDALTGEKRDGPVTRIVIGPSDRSE